MKEDDRAQEPSGGDRDRVVPERTVVRPSGEGRDSDVDRTIPRDHDSDGDPNLTEARERQPESQRSTAGDDSDVTMDRSRTLMRGGEVDLGRTARRRDGDIRLDATTRRADPEGTRGLSESRYPTAEGPPRTPRFAHEEPTVPAGSGDPAALLGCYVSRYRLDEIIGEGGMGIVYRAWDEKLQRSVALKTMRSHASLSEEAIIRFQRGATAASRLDSPYIARVYDTGHDVTSGQHYLTMEYVSGGTIAASLRHDGSGRLAADEVLRLLEQAASGMLDAERHGIVHRDIKPDNLLLQPRVENRDEFDLRIVDFGASKDAEVTLTRSPEDAPLTVRWASPEQLDDEEATHAADIYSLGATFYWLITGKIPAPGTTRTEVKRQKRAADFLDPRLIDGAVPEDLAAVIAKMTARDVNARYVSFEEVLQDVTHVRTGRGSAVGTIRDLQKEIHWLRNRQRRKTLAAVAATAVLVLGLAAAWVVTHRSESGTVRLATAGVVEQIDALSALAVVDGRDAKQMIGEIGSLRRATASVPVAPRSEWLVPSELAKEIGDRVDSLIARIQQLDRSKEVAGFRRRLSAVGNEAIELSRRESQLNELVLEVSSAVNARQREGDRIKDQVSALRSDLSAVEKILADLAQLALPKPVMELDTLIRRIESACGSLTHPFDSIRLGAIREFVESQRSERMSAAERVLTAVFPTTEQASVRLPDPASIRDAQKEDLGLLKACREELFLLRTDDALGLLDELRRLVGAADGAPEPEIDLERDREFGKLYHAITIRLIDLRGSVDSAWGHYQGVITARDRDDYKQPPEPITRGFYLWRGRFVSSEAQREFAYGGRLWTAIDRIASSTRDLGKDPILKSGLLSDRPGLEAIKSTASERARLFDDFADAAREAPSRGDPEIADLGIESDLRWLSDRARSEREFCGSLRDRAQQRIELLTQPVHSKVANASNYEGWEGLLDRRWPIEWQVPQRLTLVDVCDRSSAEPVPIFAFGDDIGGRMILVASETQSYLIDLEPFGDTEHTVGGGSARWDAILPAVRNSIELDFSGLKSKRAGSYVRASIVASKLGKSLPTWDQLDGLRSHLPLSLNLRPPGAVLEEWTSDEDEDPRNKGNYYTYRDDVSRDKRKAHPTTYSEPTGFRLALKLTSR